MTERTFRADASSKAILFGEHAVVYGQPALAVPVSNIRAYADVAEEGSGLRVRALDLGRTIRLDSPPRDSGGLALYTTVHTALQTLGVDPTSVSLDISVHSDIPIASGMGSGAAIATAIIRALFSWQQQSIDADALSAIVYESEKILHGQPSGIDNTVIAHEKPVLFSRSQGLQPISIVQPLSLVIAYTGIASRTRDAVLDVQHAWQNQRKEYDAYFETIGQLVQDAIVCLREGDIQHLGQLMLENHRILQKLDVSCQMLDVLVQSAMKAGALGAKLSGGGRGGIMIALTLPDNAEIVGQALSQAGAQRVFQTTVAATGAQP